LPTSVTRAERVARVGRRHRVAARRRRGRLVGRVGRIAEFGEALQVRREVGHALQEQANPLGLGQQPVVAGEVVGAGRYAKDLAGDAFRRAVGEGLEAAGGSAGPGARVAGRRALVVATVRGLVGRLAVVAVGRHDFRSIEVIDRAHDVELVLGQVAPAGGHVGTVLGATAVGGGTVHAADFDALIVLAQDDVDHAGDRVGSVNGRGAVLEDVDALDCSDRDAVQVDEGLVDVLREAVAGDAAAVEQHQHRVDAEASQRDRRRARRKAVAGVHRFSERAPADHGQRYQHFGQRRRATALDCRAVDDYHRVDRLHVDPRNVGAGDLDPLELLGLLRLGRKGDQRRACHAAEGQCQAANDWLQFVRHLGSSPV